MFYDNYIKLCNSINKSPSSVAEDIGIKRSTVTRWKQGNSLTDANLIKVADYFGVTKDYLLGNEEQKKPDDQKAIGLNDTRYVDLNAENKAMIDALIERLYKSQSGE